MAAAPAVSSDVLTLAAAHGNRKVQLLLFKNVQNSAELRKHLAADEKIRDMSLINSNVVAGTFQVQVAAFKALAADAVGKLTTRTLHSELVYCLAGCKHVGESLKRCGLHDHTKNVLVVLFDPTPDDVENVVSLVKGTKVPLAELTELHDPQLIQQVYKVTKEELQIGTLEDAVLAKMAAKDC